MIVDDNEINRIVIETLLKQKGLTTHIVVDGKQAVECIANGLCPDLILMDCQMPVMDGFDATRHIRRWESEHYKSRIPIVALTAAAFDHDRQHCFDAGMDDYLSKPVSITELREILKRWIDKA